MNLAGAGVGPGIGYGPAQGRAAARAHLPGLADLGL